jgi:hypothetical protein
MDAKKVTRRLRLTLVKSLALGGQYHRDFTGTFYGRRKDLEKLQAGALIPEAPVDTALEKKAL